MGREEEGVSFEVTKSVISLYVDKTKWGAVIWRKRDRVMFKESIDRLETWSRDWKLLFNVFKCKILHRGGRMLGTASQWGEGTEGDQDGEGRGGDV